MSEIKTEIKIQIIKLIEIAYSKNDGLTGKLLASSGRFSLAVDDTGVMTLSGKAGAVKMNVSKEMSDMGLDFRYASLYFAPRNNGDIRYTGSVGFKDYASISISSSLNIEELILRCSGLLCIAARLLKNPFSKVDASLKAHGVSQ
ncbi:hypothetical protein [Agarivorans gilvus]|uniref:Roadblock/LAMTOR2 domain-containing protein n=1 Tax=Agarivorans gilvus TaxID=680279 RepID=A0ABQ1I8M1_9ALTE|nr:hypothetical protein [Agarivorans gilvus]GGB21951.1 hypothetical protein GCM10007414_39200 [Agarivorans gilvus]